MKKITKALLIFLSITILFNCSNDDNPETTPENQAMRLDSIISTDNTVKILYKYNNDNINFENEIISINGDGTILKNKISLAYNSNNLINTEIYKEWNGTEYINYWKIEYTYNLNQNITTKIGSSWDSALNNWINPYIVEYYNYNSGILTEIIENYEDTNTNHDEKSNYIYENDILKKIEKYRWNDDDDDWQFYPWRKYEYIYDSGNLTDIIEYYDHSPNDGTWEQGDARYELEYDNAYTMDNIILPFDSESRYIIPFNTNHMIIKMKNFDASDNDSWELYLEKNYFYTNVTN